MAHTEQFFERFETYEEVLWFHTELSAELKVDKLTLPENSDKNEEKITDTLP